MQVIELYMFLHEGHEGCLISSVEINKLQLMLYKSVKVTKLY